MTTNDTNVFWVWLALKSTLHLNRPESDDMAGEMTSLAGSLLVSNVPL